MARDPGPPPLIPQNTIHVERTVEGKQVVTHYRNLSGEDVLPPTYHLQGREGGFVPSAPSAQLVEMEEQFVRDE
jgi:hypothetical protein